MKKTVSLLSNLLLASTLFWGVPLVEANELVETTVVDLAGYCHIKFAPMSEATLAWGRPELNAEAEKSIDFYGPCDYDPMGATEARVQRAILRASFTETAPVTSSYEHGIHAPREQAFLPRCAFSCKS